MDGQKESALQDSQKAMELELEWEMYKEKAHELALLAIQKFLEDEVIFYLAKLACEYHRPQEAMKYLQKIEKSNFWGDREMEILPFKDETNFHPAPWIVEGRNV